MFDTRISPPGCFHFSETERNTRTVQQKKKGVGIREPAGTVRSQRRHNWAERNLLPKVSARCGNGGAEKSIPSDKANFIGLDGFFSLLFLFARFSLIEALSVGSGGGYFFSEDSLMSRWSLRFC